MNNPREKRCGWFRHPWEPWQGGWSHQSPISGFFHRYQLRRCEQCGREQMRKVGVKITRVAAPSRAVKTPRIEAK